MPKKPDKKFQQDAKKWVVARLKEGWSPGRIIEVAARFDHHAGDVIKALNELKKEKK